MNFSKTPINYILRTADIEGFIHLGAPTDEYDSEAEIIARCLNEITSTEISDDVVLTLLTDVWKKSFGLGTKDIQARQKELAKLAQTILNTTGSAR